MSDSKQALQDLLEKVEAGGDGGYVHAFSGEVFPEPNRQQVVNAYNGSQDAAMALVGRALPDWDAAVFKSGSAWLYIPTRNGPPIKEFRVENKVPSRALLIAILKALISEQDT